MCIKINSRQTGSRNLMGPKNASHDMGYLYDACDQISDFCHQQLLRKMQRKISWTDRGKTVYTHSIVVYVLSNATWHQ